MTLVTRRSFGILSLGFATAAAAILRPKSAHAEDIAVHIDNFVFEPKELSLKVGQTVTWTNRDDIPHTVACAGKFRSKTMDSDGTFSFTFTAPGEYKYFCSLHPHMTGAVKVE
jgi:plastocyanin